MGVWRAGGNHSPYLPRPYHLSAILPLLLLLLIAPIMAGADADKPHQCKLEACSEKYQEAIDYEGVIKGSNARYCFVLHTYLGCIRATARSCRGTLAFHTTSSLVVQWDKEYNCSYVRFTADPPVVMSSHPPSARCVYRGRKHVSATCSLFGDPHLRTFNGEKQTCKILGAWPLLDNAYLAVQVTNEAVIKGFKASAASKITVIIKEFNPCSQQKTYEATKDYLPATFTDGTSSSGLENSVQISENPSERHIKISMKHIATTIIIRRVGHYLSFTIHVPTDVVTQGLDPEELQLCVKGCPTLERIDNQNTVSLKSSSLRLAMSRDIAVGLCRAHNLTKFYFESCVFDLMTTGDRSFLDAANEAMLDNLALNNNKSDDVQEPLIVVQLPTTEAPSEEQTVFFMEKAVRSAANRNCIMCSVFLLAIVLLVINR